MAGRRGHVEVDRIFGPPVAKGAVLLTLGGVDCEPGDTVVGLMLLIERLLHIGHSPGEKLVTINGIHATFDRE